MIYNLIKIYFIHNPLQLLIIKYTWNSEIYYTAEVLGLFNFFGNDPVQYITFYYTLEVLTQDLGKFKCSYIMKHEAIQKNLNLQPIIFIFFPLNPKFYILLVKFLERKKVTNLQIYKNLGILKWS